MQNLLETLLGLDFEQTVVCLLLPAELAKHAVCERKKAVTRYTSSSCLGSVFLLRLTAPCRKCFANCVGAGGLNKLQPGMTIA